MGLFSSSKKIYHKDFKKSLREIPQLSPRERTYTEGFFRDSLKKGLSEYELKKEINRLKKESDDPLTPYEVGKIKDKLKEHFK